MENQIVTEQLVKCYHCGDECKDTVIIKDDLNFCCEGCRLVYEILNENNLCRYYQMNEKPGISPGRPSHQEQFAYLDQPEILSGMLQFSEGGTQAVQLFIPQIHCSSCIWLLEHLNKLQEGIIRSRVDFVKRSLLIYFKEQDTSLRKVVELLASLGYMPVLQMDLLESGKVPAKSKEEIYKIGIAGFCFGNIMLFSFPEYFSLNSFQEPGFNHVFNYVNLGLSLPVFFYCSKGFFRTALNGLKQRFLNIDVPIALGILVMFLRSIVEIVWGYGSGYLDTMAGLVFFMLIGRSFQNKTYQTLSFERNYKSFFPVAVLCRREGREVGVQVSDLKKGDRILIRNEELIPADALLVKGNACIDYSFVTGESRLINKQAGELIYAGGKHKGGIIELEIVKAVSQSYLTQLWNQDAFNSEKLSDKFQQLVNRISHYFTIVLVLIALAGLSWWYYHADPAKAWNAFTAVLIIACPCALAISSPFTLGNVLRIFGRKKFYLKNASTIEKLANADTLVFDKTGTLTRNKQVDVNFSGIALSALQTIHLASLLRQSAHPISKQLFDYLAVEGKVPVAGFQEITGKGIKGVVDGVEWVMGSAEFLGLEDTEIDQLTTRTYLRVNGNLLGFFSLGNKYRDGLRSMIDHFKSKNYRMVVLTGDNEGEESRLRDLFGANTHLRFRQSPADKLQAVQELQQQGSNVLMIGDGLNDAGALRQSDIGISISDDVNNFSPACDAILDAGSFRLLPSFLKAARASKEIILISFCVAILYNIVGLWFALQGTLSPVFAAILMPLSSITIISLTTGLSGWASRRIA